MKNILTILTVFAMFFTACEQTSNDDGPVSGQIKLTSNDSIQVGDSHAVAFIRYEIINAVDGLEVKAESDVEWIGEFDYKDQGKIGFTVQANQTASPREGVITVTYDTSSFEVKVTQKAPEKATVKEINVKYLQGHYYDIQSGMYNYYLAFSDLGMDANNLFTTPLAFYYFVDLYTMKAPADMDNVVIPDGVYEYNPNNTGAPETFMETYSWYQINDETGFSLSQTAYDTGRLIVEGDKVTLEITLTIDGTEETHSVIYNGDYSLVRM